MFELFGDQATETSMRTVSMILSGFVVSVIASDLVTSPKWWLLALSGLLYVVGISLIVGGFMQLVTLGR